MKLKKSPVGKQIDYSGLTAPVDNAAIRQFLEENSYSKSHARLEILLRIFGLLFVIWGGFSMVTGAMASGVTGITGGIQLVVVGIVLLLVTPVIKRLYTTSVRISRFAHANGWSYMHRVVNPSHQGVIFGVGHSRAAKDIIYMNGDDETASFEVGNYQYTTGSGKSQRTHYWTYCCIEMDRHVPHMLLDAKANNASLFGKNLASNLPVSLRKDQVLSLEGDFDKYFTLYAPKDYKRDALYIFTPDLMALLIDAAHSFDAEVIDNRLYIYTRQSGGSGGALTRPDFMYRLLSVIHAVGMKVHRQTDYYADEAVGDRSIDVVAAGGRRLKQGVSWFAVIIILLVIVLLFAPLVFDLIGGR